MMVQRENFSSTDEITKSNRYLHSPSSFARKNLLYIQEAGTLQSLQPHKCVRENLDSFLIMIVLDGKGILEIAGENFGLNKGDCVWIDCMQHYEHISDKENAWRLAWVHFNGQGARSIYELFLKYNENMNIVTALNQKEIEEIIMQLRERQSEKHPLVELHCAELLLHLINVIFGYVASNIVMNNNFERQTAGELRNFINDHYIENSILEALTEEFSKSIAELDDIFDKEYGITLEEYIANRRYNAAKELLRFSVKPIADIARESGIGDMVLMQKLFYENEGMSAEEYRQKWAGWVRN